MRTYNFGDKLASQQIKEGPPREAWIKEQVKFETERLKAILRDCLATDEEKSIAQSQLANYHEMLAKVFGTAPDWLQQIYFLAS